MSNFIICFAMIGLSYIGYLHFQFKYIHDDMKEIKKLILENQPSINELRHIHGMQPIPGADKRYITKE